MEDTDTIQLTKVGESEVLGSANPNLKQSSIPQPKIMNVWVEKNKVNEVKAHTRQLAMNETVCLMTKFSRKLIITSNYIIDHVYHWTGYKKSKMKI